MLLPCAILGFSVPGISQAMLSMSEEDLSDVTAQDGITVNVSNSQTIKASRLNWIDDRRALQLGDVSLSGLNAKAELDVGAASATGDPAVSLTTVVKPFNLSIGSIGVCGSASTAAFSTPQCSGSMGDLGLVTTSDTTASLVSRWGTVSGTGSSVLGFNLSAANVYLGNSYQSQRSLLILKDLSAAGTFTGNFSAAAATGLRLVGDLNLPRVNSNRGGLQFDLFSNPGIASGYTTAGASGLARLGMSGTINNLDLRIIGDAASSLIDLSGATGFSNASGLRFSLSGNLNPSDFELEVGEPSSGSASTVRFSNFVSFLDGGSAVPSPGSFKSGDVYLNVVPAGSKLSNFPASVQGSMVAAADAVAVSVRGAEMQAYPRVAVIYDYAAGTGYLLNSSGSLMTPIYGLDANLLLMPGGHPAAATRRGIGFDFAAMVKGFGTGADAGKTTSLLLSDTSAGQYIGLRNISARLKIDGGQLFLLDPVNDGAGANGIGISANNLQLGLAGQFATDNIPDGTVANQMKQTGHMFGLNAQIQSSNSSITLLPGSGYIGWMASLNLVAGNNSTVGQCSGLGSGTCFVITEPVDNSQIQLSTISGRVDVTDGRIDFTKDASLSTGLGGTYQRGYISFANTITFGQGSGSSDVFRVGDINFVGGSGPTSYRLGELVIPGGELYTRIELRPR